MRQYLLFVMFTVLFCAVPLLSVAAAGDEWEGSYAYTEVSEKVAWDYKITINKHYATITVDGPDATIRVLATVKKEAESVSLIFDRYLLENYHSSFSQGDELLRLEKKGSDLETKWGKMTRLGMSFLKSGLCFVKEQGQTQTLPEAKVAAYSWFGFGSVILGGFAAGEWLSAEDILGNENYYRYWLREGDSCKVYSQKEFLGEGSVFNIFSEYTNKYDDDFRGPDTHRFDIQMKDKSHLTFRDVRLTVKSSWESVPRRPLVMATNNATYKTVVKNYLERQGLSNVTPNIVQLFRIDLEGDGVDEVFIVAQNIIEQTRDWAEDKRISYMIPGGAQKGNYSLVLMRKVIDGQVYEIPLQEFIATKNATPADDEWQIPFLFKIFQFADLNGDGVLEVIMGVDHYEGYGYTVYEIKGDKATMVLANGAGA